MPDDGENRIAAILGPLLECLIEERVDHIRWARVILSGRQGVEFDRTYCIGAKFRHQLLCSNDGVPARAGEVEVGDESDALELPR